MADKIELIEIKETGAVTENIDGRAYSRNLIVKWLDSNDTRAPTEDEVLEEVGIRFSSKHPRTNAYCSTYTALPVDGWYHWEVDATYVPKGIVDARPTDQVPTISIDSKPVTRIVERAYYNVSQGDESAVTQLQLYEEFLKNTSSGPELAILDSNGRPFQTAVTDVFQDLIINIDINYPSTLNVNGLLRFRDSINLWDITIAGVSIPSKRGHISKLSVVRKWDYLGNPYYAVHYEITVRTDGKSWVLDVLNLSYMMWDTENNVHRQIMESDVDPVKGRATVPVQEPQIINRTTGQLEYPGTLNPVEPGTFPDPTNPDIWMQYQSKVGLLWDSLNLPPTMTPELDEEKRPG